MKAIKIETSVSEKDLTNKSHWWGFPDLPLGVEFPYYENHNEADGYDDTMTFICQIRLEDLSALDKDNLLPKTGMLYFFANMDYFLEESDELYDGLGYWSEKNFKVIYSPECNDLHTHKVLYSDGTPACLPAEEMVFSQTESRDYGLKLLGKPYFDEVPQRGYVNLLQIDEEDRWHLRFYDCGMVNFLIKKSDLLALNFDKVKLYMHCL